MTEKQKKIAIRLAGAAILIFLLCLGGYYYPNI